MWKTRELKFWAAATMLSLLAGCGGDGGVRLNAPAQPQAGALADSFAATLSGARTGTPGTTGQPGAERSGQATASLVVDPISRRMVVLVTTAGVSASTVLLREMPGGLPGQALFALTESPAGSGVWTATTGLSDSQLASLRGGQLGLEISSLNAGSLRGQLQAQPAAQTSGGGAGFGVGDAASGPGEPAMAPASFAAALRSSDVVPPTPSVAHGSGNATIDPGTRQITVALATAGMAATSAALRRGAAGENGPLLLQLAEGPPGTNVWLARGMLSEEQYAALAAGTLYLSVESAAYPEGEVRGQLLPRMDATGSGTPAAGIPQAGSPALLAPRIPAPDPLAVQPPRFGLPASTPLAPPAFDGSRTRLITDTSPRGVFPGPPLPALEPLTPRLDTTGASE